MQELRLLMMIDQVGKHGNNPSKVEQVRAAVNQDRRHTIHDLCSEVGIGYGSCQQILTEQLNMHRIAAKFVPRVLTHDQKDSRVAICQELKETVINDPTLPLNVITGDESIVYAYDPETKLQSSQWKTPGSPRPKKARKQKSKLNTMLICFYDQEGIIHREFDPPGMTVNADFCCDVLRGYVKMCRVRGHRNSKSRTSISTTTMPRLTGPLKFRSFWPRTT